MRTRALARDDLDAVNEITVACNRDYASWGPEGWSPPVDAWEDERAGWAEILDNPGGWGRLATLGTRPVGAVAIDGDEVRRLFVEPDAQGRGIGTRLLAEAETELCSRGRAEVELWTPEGSRAIAFYEGRGWRPDGRSRFHERLALPLIGLSKRL